MALFNLKRKQKKVVNRAGGKAYDQTPEMKLASMLLTSFAQDQYYRSAKHTFAELVTLLEKVDPYFAAQAAIFARTKYGMRSITHVLAAHLAKHASGQEWARTFYDRVVWRPDDMLEISSVYIQHNQKGLPNAMKRGFAKAFDRFDGYQLAKYRGENREFKLVDLVNLVHPVPTEKNEAGLKDLVDGTLRSTGTWESKLTKAGQDAKTDEEKAANKAQAWDELIRNRKIGYFALLRNLRNILVQAPGLVDEAIIMLTDERLIRSKRNLVMPFRYLVAYKQFASLNSHNGRKILEALDRAIEIACQNVPALENTLVVVDNSGSMGSPVAGSDHMKCAEMGAVFGMILAKRSNADIMEFGTNARYIKYRLRDSVMEFGKGFQSRNRVGHGTNFQAIFNTANKAYDRIVIFSDMQGWIGGGAPDQAVKNYKNRFDADPFIYSFDLRGYGTLQFPRERTFALAGFSNKVFDLMGILEADPKALINEIRKIEL